MKSETWKKKRKIGKIDGDGIVQFIWCDIDEDIFTFALHTHTHTHTH